MQTYIKNIIIIKNIVDLGSAVDALAQCRYTYFNWRVLRSKSYKKKTVELRSALDALAQIFLAGALASEFVLLY